VDLCLTDFRALDPAFRASQRETLEWLAAVHARAEATRAAAVNRSGEVGEVEGTKLLEQMRRRFGRFGCGEDKIATRGHELGDFTHTRWNDMELYRVHAEPAGAGMAARTEQFARLALSAVTRLYAEPESPPQDLVHVTCTGYVAPSAAQRLVAAKGWGAQTRVTHAYHMGCYAAIPALRLAAGFEASAGERAVRSERRTDIVHTELCSLHVDPLAHSAEQLVVQSLFADGFIRYTVRDQSSVDDRAPALRLLFLDEWILADSAGAMTWSCSDSGMHMTLARDVPERFGGALREFLSHITGRAGLEPTEALRASYAVHPGGPRILDCVRVALELTEAQIEHSRSVLRERGNMSSATLPHIWQRMATSRAVRHDQAIVSLAFGPGLTICGAVLRKAAG
jgi:predicted naringenin-chalcone synthase